MSRQVRPFLTARWTDLLLLNFPVPNDAIAAIAPPGTEVDLFEGRAYISVVGFQFRDTRVHGCAWPAHMNFLEINLRYYVRRVVDGEVRRGVVFVREIIPRRLIALIANGFYHENYVCRPMRCENADDRISYSWQSRSTAGKRWNTLAARIAVPFRAPLADSFEEFIVEHYWGYARGRDGTTREYQVTHDPWRVAHVDEATWNCDVAATYDTPLAKYLTSPPTNALIADGAAVQIFHGHRL